MPLKNILKAQWEHLKLFDKNLIIYWILLSLLILIFHQNIDNWIWHFGLHILFIAIVITLIPRLDRQENSIIKFVRSWYIVACFPFLYWDVGPFLHAVFQGEFDPIIINLDIRLFGELPNIWVQGIVNPILTEIMQLSYSIYWITIPLGSAIFYFKKEHEHFERLLYYITFTFFLSYFIFIFFPVAGPRFYIADQIHIQYEGLFFSNYLRQFVTEVGFRGGAFPSSHVGVAVVILIYIWYFKPKVAISVFLPLVIALSLATVYGQYHYLSDVIAGLLMGSIIGLWGGYQSRRKLAKSKT